MSRVLCVIPARGGSKGIPRKNLAKLAGRPLLHYALSAALAARTPRRVVVSSENATILEAAAQYGPNVALPRPRELAADDTPSHPVAVHALEACEADGDEAYDYLLLLQATSPLVTPQDIDGVIRTLIETGADSCVTVVRSRDHPSKLKQLEGDRLLPYAGEERTYARQALPALYKRNGACYAVQRLVLLSGSLYGQDVRAVVMPRERSVDIDEPLDLEYAEFLLARQGPVAKAG